MSDNCEHDPVGKSLESAFNEIERLRDELENFKAGYTYSYSCQKDHPEIGSNFGVKEECPVCQALDRIKKLEGKLRMKSLAAYDKSCEFFKDKHIITDKQISAAQKRLYDLKEEQQLQGWWMLEELGIKRCEGCKDCCPQPPLDVDVDPPRCNGKKWTKGGE